MLFRSFLAVAPAFALILAPAGLAAQEPAKRPPAEAPYQTKLECAVINAFMSGFLGDETEEGQVAAAKGEEWINVALAEKPDDQMKVATDFEAVAKRLQAEIEGIMEKEEEEGFFALVERYAGACEPFGG
jgi:hypothetical protein